MEPKPIDMDAFKKGTIPWSVDECIEIMGWYQRLNKTPKDDWDLKERGFCLKDEESGEVKKLVLNQFMPINQLGLYMAHRYKSDVMPYHFNRLMEIMAFLCDHLQELKLDGFSRTDSDERDEICIPVLQALCELPFSKKTIVNDEERYKFDYQEVAQRARELLKEYEEDR
jgi:hypothetical protein